MLTAETPIWTHVEFDNRFCVPEGEDMGHCMLMTKKGWFDCFRRVSQTDRLDRFIIDLRFDNKTLQAELTA